MADNVTHVDIKVFTKVREWITTYSFADIYETTIYFEKLCDWMLYCFEFLCKYLYIKSRKYTGRFIMFSVITNIYNKKTKGPTSMELFTATEKLNIFFLTTRDVRCVHHGWHGTHRYNIQVLAPHASARWRVCGKN
jgi:hypothetical protein